MIGRRTQTEGAVPASTAAAAPAGEKPPMREADCFKPSTFASRKAEAEERRAGIDERELVYMGRTGTLLMKDRRNKDVYVEGELFYERRHPNKRWFRLDGDTQLQPMFEETRRDPAPDPVGVLPRRPPAPMIHAPAGPTPPPWRP